MNFLQDAKTRKLLLREEDEPTFNSDTEFYCEPHLLAEGVVDHEDLEITINSSCESNNDKNLDESFDTVITELTEDNTIIIDSNCEPRELDVELESPNSYYQTDSVTSIRPVLRKSKRKNSILTKLLRLTNKSKSQISNTCDNNDNQHNKCAENQPQQLQPQPPQKQNKNTIITNDDHTRDLSSLSTTPLLCLKDDVTEYLSKNNSKAAAFLEKERSSRKETKVMEAERKKDLERLQQNEHQRQTLISRQNMMKQYVQQNVQEKMVQLDDHDLMCLSNISCNSKVSSVEPVNKLSSFASDVRPHMSDYKQQEKATSTCNITKRKKKLHKRYFSLHKENSTLNNHNEAITKHASSKPEADTTETATNTAETTTNTTTSALERSASLKTNDRKLLNDRRLLKRYGSLSTYDKQFMNQVFQSDQ